MEGKLFDPYVLKRAFQWFPGVRIPNLDTMPLQVVLRLGIRGPVVDGDPAAVRRNRCSAAPVSLEPGRDREQLIARRRVPDS